MIVIIEGLDAVGKTTICQKIAENYNYNYIKESYTNVNSEKTERITNMMARLISNKNFIYDRTTLIDDFVYEFLNLTDSPLTEYFDIIVPLLQHCKIIHLCLNEDVRQQRFEQRGDKYINNDDIKQIYKNYKRFYENLNNVNYITLTGNVDEDIKKIMEVIND